MKNTSNAFRLISVIIFFCSSIVVVAQNNQNNAEKNVLILHSYHQGLEWTDNQSIGIQSVFEDQPNVNLIFEYLDTKRNFSSEYFDALKSFYKTKANQLPYNVIITCDNAAFDFMRKYKDDYYPGIPVAYCGVNNLDTAILNELPSFFGYDEKVDYEHTISSMRKIFPERKNVLIINDNTTTGQAIREELLEVLPQFKSELNFEIFSDFTLKDVEEKVKSLDDSYIIYLLVINRDIEGQFISYRKGISAIHEVSKVPIFGSWDFYENRGLFGGKITRGFDQGEHAARMAENLMEKGVSENISQINMVVNKYVFDYNEMERFGVSSSQLPENSLIINKPKQSEGLLKTIIIIALALLVVSVFLTVRLILKKKRSQKLQELVDEKTARLLNMNVALKEIITKKDRFLSIMSHDLKGPFNYILGFASMLAEDYDTLDKDEQRKCIVKINEGLESTYKLLESILSWSYAQSGSTEFNPKRENLSIITSEIIDVLRISADQKNISIVSEVPDLIFVTADKNMLSTIIRNLIFNAIKFTPKNGIIEIGIAEMTNDNKQDFLAYSVKDNGVGMSKEKQSKLFDIGEVSSTKGTDNESGTGLGLILCKEFVDKHKGELWVESQANSGSSFTFTLPIV